MKKLGILLLSIIFVLNLSITKAQTKCEPATGLKVDSKNFNSCTISWTNSTNASAYVLKYWEKGSYNLKWKKTTTNPYTINWLKPNTTYQCEIKSLCADSASMYVEKIEFTTEAPACIAATDLSVSDIKGNAATLTWNGTGDSYLVIIMGDFPNGKSIRYIKTTNKSITLNLLKSTTLYQWCVKSVCNKGGQNYYATSCGKDFFTGAKDCYNPSYIIASDVTPYSANLTWEAVPSATKYKIKYIDKTDNKTYYRKINTTANNFLLTPLKYETTYECTVLAFCNGKFIYSGNKTISFTTKAFPGCKQITDLSTAKITETTAELKWKACNIANYYTVRYKEKDGKDSTYKYRITYKMPFKIEKLKKATEYEWSVKAVYMSNGVKHNNIYSETATFKTLGSKLMSTTTDLSVYPNPNAGNFTVIVSNTENSVIGIYNLQGQEVYTENISTSDYIKNFDMSNYKKGIYFIKVSNNDNVKIQKVIIE